MSNVVTLGFHEPEIHAAAAKQLRRLGTEARSELLSALDAIRRGGVVELQNHLLVARDTPFLRKVQRIVLIMAGRALGLIEMFRRRIKLIAALDLDLLKTRRRDLPSIIWGQSELRRRENFVFEWSAWVSILPDNSLGYAQQVKKTVMRHTRDVDARQVHIEMDVRLKLRGCRIFEVDVVSASACGESASFHQDLHGLNGLSPILPPS